MKTGLFIYLRAKSIAVLATALLLLVSACQSAERSAFSDRQKTALKKIYVIGHRGAAGLAPENTLAAFARACSIGVDALELDVLLTADRKAVVHHDFSLKPELTRTPDGKWLASASPPAIKELRLVDLKTYDVGRLKPGSRYSQRYPDQTPVDGERIPTLREVIRLLQNQCERATQLWIEIKTTPEKPDVTPQPRVVTDTVVGILREEAISDRVRILSFDWRNLVYVQKIAPDIPTVYLSLEGVRLNNIKPGRPGASPWTAGLDIDDFAGSIPRAIQAAGGRCWAPYHKHVTISDLQTAHRLGIQVFVWTPDGRPELRRLIEMGVDGIITNRPDRLRSVLNEN